MKVGMRSVDSFSLSEHETGKFVVQLLRCRWTDLKAVWLQNVQGFLTAHVLSVFT